MYRRTVSNESGRGCLGHSSRRSYDREEGGVLLQDRERNREIQEFDRARSRETMTDYDESEANYHAKILGDPSENQPLVGVQRSQGTPSRQESLFSLRNLVINLRQYLRINNRGAWLRYTLVGAAIFVIVVVGLHGLISIYHSPASTAVVDQIGEVNVAFETLVSEGTPRGDVDSSDPTVNPGTILDRKPIGNPNAGMDSKATVNAGKSSVEPQKTSTNAEKTSTNAEKSNIDAAGGNAARINAAGGDVHDIKDDRNLAGADVPAEANGETAADAKTDMNKATTKENTNDAKTDSIIKDSTTTENNSDATTETGKSMVQKQSTQESHLPSVIPERPGYVSWNLEYFFCYGFLRDGVKRLMERETEDNLHSRTTTVPAYYRYIENVSPDYDRYVLTSSFVESGAKTAEGESAKNLRGNASGCGGGCKGKSTSTGNRESNANAPPKKDTGCTGGCTGSDYCTGCGGGESFIERTGSDKKADSEKANSFIQKADSDEPSSKKTGSCGSASEKTDSMSTKNLSDAGLSLADESPSTSNTFVTYASRVEYAWRAVIQYLWLPVKSAEFSYTKNLRFPPVDILGLENYSENNADKPGKSESSNNGSGKNENDTLDNGKKERSFLQDGQASTGKGLIQQGFLETDRTFLENDESDEFSLQSDRSLVQKSGVVLAVSTLPGCRDQPGLEGGDVWEMTHPVFTPETLAEQITKNTNLESSYVDPIPPLYSFLESIRIFGIFSPASETRAGNEGKKSSEIDHPGGTLDERKRFEQLQGFRQGMLTALLQPMAENGGPRLPERSASTTDKKKLITENWHLFLKGINGLLEKIQKIRNKVGKVDSVEKLGVLNQLGLYGKRLPQGVLTKKKDDSNAKNPPPELTNLLSELLASCNSGKAALLGTKSFMSGDGAVWQLFHLLAQRFDERQTQVGVGEGTSSNSAITQETKAKAASFARFLHVVRKFMGRFFMCQRCVKHFVRKTYIPNEKTLVDGRSNLETTNELDVNVLPQSKIKADAYYVDKVAEVRKSRVQGKSFALRTVPDEFGVAGGKDAPKCDVCEEDDAHLMYLENVDDATRRTRIPQTVSPFYITEVDPYSDVVLEHHNDGKENLHIGKCQRLLHLVNGDDMGQSVKHAVDIELKRQTKLMNNSENTNYTPPLWPWGIGSFDNGSRVFAVDYTRRKSMSIFLWLIHNEVTQTVYKNKAMEKVSRAKELREKWEEQHSKPVNPKAGDQHPAVANQQGKVTPSSFSEVDTSNDQKALQTITSTNGEFTADTKVANVNFLNAGSADATNVPTADTNLPMLQLHQTQEPQQTADSAKENQQNGDPTTGAQQNVARSTAESKASSFIQIETKENSLIQKHTYGNDEGESAEESSSTEEGSGDEEANAAGASTQDNAASTQSDFTTGNGNKDDTTSSRTAGNTDTSSTTARDNSEDATPSTTTTTATMPTLISPSLGLAPKLPIENGLVSRILFPSYVDCPECYKAPGKVTSNYLYLNSQGSSAILTPSQGGGDANKDALVKDPAEKTEIHTDSMVSSDWQYYAETLRHSNCDVRSVIGGYQFASQQSTSGKMRDFASASYDGWKELVNFHSAQHGNDYESDEHARAEGIEAGRVKLHANWDQRCCPECYYDSLTGMYMENQYTDKIFGIDLESTKSNFSPPLLGTNVKAKELYSLADKLLSKSRKGLYDQQNSKNLMNYRDSISVVNAKTVKGEQIPIFDDEYNIVNPIKIISSRTGAVELSPREIQEQEERYGLSSSARGYGISPYKSLIKADAGGSWTHVVTNGLDTVASVAKTFISIPFYLAGSVVDGVRNYVNKGFDGIYHINEENLNVENILTRDTYSTEPLLRDFIPFVDCGNLGGVKKAVQNLVARQSTEVGDQIRENNHQDGIISDYEATMYNIFNIDEVEKFLAEKYGTLFV